VQVELAQAISQTGWCENFLQVGLDANNYFMIDVGATSMVLRARVNGANDQTVISFDATAHRHWRIRHNQGNNTVTFDTSPDASNWTTRKTVTAAFSLTALRFYLYAGAWGTGNSNPGAAKYDNFQLATNSGSTANVQWLVSDQLGTPRMVLDKTGSLANTKRHDYLPFGEELLAGTGNRTPQQGYVADNVRQKFTRKERDNETGLDYFLARYNSSIQGRFTGVDPYNIVLEKQADEDSRGAGRQFLRYLGHPQNWNRYAYVANNPLKYIDPDGAEIRFGNADPSQQLTADEEAALRNAVATLRQQSAAANAFFSLYVQPSGQGPDLDIQVMADQLFDNLPEVSRNQNILGVTSPGMVDINPGNPNDVRSASTLMVIRQSAVNLRSENQDRQQGHETKLEGIMSHEIVHGAHITTDYNGFLQAHQDARRNNIPYRQRPNERIANTGSTVIAVEREIRRHITREQRNVRWRNP